MGIRGEESDGDIKGTTKQKFLVYVDFEVIEIY